MDRQCRSRNVYLSEDILYTEIFPRLPAKGVGKCRCLSKEWRTKLSTSKFIDMHLERQENSILIATLDRSENITRTLAFRTTVNSLRWGRTEPLIALEKHIIHSTCNGLVLLLDIGQGKMFSLMNPITRQHLVIPNSPERVTLPALGYDTCSMDYKIVYPRFGNQLSVYVYSVKMGIWKRCDSSLYRGAIRNPYFRRIVRLPPMAFLYVCHKTVVLNGVFYWIFPVTIKHTDTSQPHQRGGAKKHVLFTFELAGEVFGEISLPPTRFVRGPFVLGECLCTLHLQEQGGGVDLWAMKKYGDNNSWMKLASWPLEEVKRTPRDENLPFDMVKPRYDEPMCLIDGGQKFLVRDSVNDGCISVYDLKEQNAVDAVDDGCIGFGSFPRARIFVESLVSPIPAHIDN